MIRRLVILIFFFFRFLIEEMVNKHAEIDGLSESFTARRGDGIRLNPDSQKSTASGRCSCWRFLGHCYLFKWKFWFLCISRVFAYQDQRSKWGNGRLSEAVIMYNVITCVIDKSFTCSLLGKAPIKNQQLSEWHMVTELLTIYCNTLGW